MADITPMSDDEEETGVLQALASSSAFSRRRKGFGGSGVDHSTESHENFDDMDTLADTGDKEPPLSSGQDHAQASVDSHATPVRAGATAARRNPSPVVERAGPSGNARFAALSDDEDEDSAAEDEDKGEGGSSDAQDRSDGTVAPAASPPSASAPAPRPSSVSADAANAPVEASPQQGRYLDMDSADDSDDGSLHMAGRESPLLADLNLDYKSVKAKGGKKGGGSSDEDSDGDNNEDEGDDSDDDDEGDAAANDKAAPATRRKAAADSDEENTAAESDAEGEKRELTIKEKALAAEEAAKKAQGSRRLTTMQKMRQLEEEQKRREQESALLKREQTYTSLKVKKQPRGSGKSALKDLFAKRKAGSIAKTGAKAENETPSMLHYRKRLSAKVLNVAPQIGRGLAHLRPDMALANKSPSKRNLRDAEQFMVPLDDVKPTKKAEDVHMSSRLELHRQLLKNIAAGRRTMFARDEAARREEEEDYDDEEAEGLFAEVADEQEDEKSEGDGAAVDGTEEASDADDADDNSTAEEEEVQSGSEGASDEDGPTEGDVDDGAAGDADMEPPESSASAHLLEESAPLTQESSSCALSFPDKAAKPQLALDSQDAKIEMIVTDQLDDLAMLCSGQFEAPASNARRQTVDSITTEGPLQAAEDADTFATPVSSASAFVDADSTHSSAPVSSKEHHDDHNGRSQNFREEQRVVQEPAVRQGTLPDLTESLATQDDPIDDADETVGKCSETGSLQEDAEHAEASDARVGLMRKGDIDRFGLEDLKVARQKAVQGAFFDNEAEMSDDGAMHHDGNEDDDDDMFPTQDDADDIISDSNEALTQGPAMHVLQRQLEEQEEDDDLERLKAQYLHREKDDLAPSRSAKGADSERLRKEREREREKRRQHRERKEKRRQRRELLAMPDAKTVERTSSGSLSTPTPTMSFGGDTQDLDSPESSADEREDVERVVKRSEFHAFLLSTKQESCQALFEDEDSRLVSRYVKPALKREQSSKSLSRQSSSKPAKPAPPTPPRLGKRRSSTSRASSFLLRDSQDLEAITALTSTKQNVGGKSSFIFSVNSTSQSMDVAESHFGQLSGTEAPENSGRRKQSAPLRKLPNGQLAPSKPQNAFSRVSAALRQAINAKRPKLQALM